MSRLNNIRFRYCFVISTTDLTKVNGGCCIWQHLNTLPYDAPRSFQNPFSFITVYPVWYINIWRRQFITQSPFGLKKCPTRTQFICSCDRLLHLVVCVIITPHSGFDWASQYLCNSMMHVYLWHTYMYITFFLFFDIIDVCGLCCHYLPFN